ncbi:MAG: SWIM zinc finger family protein, partial [Bacteroidetes bacterium]
MNFPLKNLELHLPEECLVLAERLVEEHGVEELRETEKHLWVGWVAGLEVEVQVSPSKVLAASCECEEFQGQGMCPHVGAVLFALRREQQQRKERKRTRKPPTRRLTVNAVIEQAPPEELLAFVRQYAKTNRAFALALKARFAGAVSTPDEREKYSRLLETALQGHRDEKDNITFRGA